MSAAVLLCPPWTLLFLCCYLPPFPGWHTAARGFPHNSECPPADNISEQSEPHSSSWASVFRNGETGLIPPVYSKGPTVQLLHPSWESNWARGHMQTSQTLFFSSAPLTTQPVPQPLSLRPGDRSLQRDNDVISSGDSANILSSLSSKIKVHNKGCVDRPPEILIIGGSMIKLFSYRWINEWMISYSPGITQNYE